MIRHVSTKARLHSRTDAVRHRPLRATVQVGGELLITAGVVVLLYIAWQLWWTNVEAGAHHDDVVSSLADSYVSSAPDGTAAQDRDAQTAQQDDGAEPPVMDPVAYGEAMGIMYIPRFGEDYSVPIASGVGLDVLDKLGLGHYPETGLPGETGNFAVAGHRQSNGKVLDLIHTLVPGDELYVHTADGYYTYEYRDQEIVLPHRTDVLLPVPTRPGVEPSEPLLTLTTCWPRYGDEKRVIAYAVMTSWRPLEAGPPAAIADRVAEISRR